MKYKYPVRIPTDWKLVLSQGFHANHNGNDVVVDDPLHPTGSPLTYGLPVVWPFPFPGKPYDSLVNAPLAKDATKAHVQVDGIDPNDGTSYSLLYIHLSGAIYTINPGENTNVVFNAGDTIGYIGNSGFVKPKPTIDKPFDGSHLHLGLGVKKAGELNFTMVDPSLYFDINDPWRGEDNPSRDQPVYDWVREGKPQDDTLPSVKLEVLGNQMMATNPTQAKLVLLVAKILKAFNS